MTDGLHLEDGVHLAWTDKRLGFLINVNDVNIGQGIKRFVLSEGYVYMPTHAPHKFSGISCFPACGRQVCFSGNPDDGMNAE